MGRVAQSHCTFAHTMSSSWLHCPVQRCLALLLHTLQLLAGTDLCTIASVAGEQSSELMTVQYS